MSMDKRLLSKIKGILLDAVDLLFDAIAGENVNATRSAGKDEIPKFGDSDIRSEVEDSIWDESIRFKNESDT